MNYVNLEALVAVTPKPDIKKVTWKNMVINLVLFILKSIRGKRFEKLLSFLICLSKYSGTVRLARKNCRAKKKCTVAYIGVIVIMTSI